MCVYGLLTDSFARLLTCFFLSSLLLFLLLNSLRDALVALVRPLRHSLLPDPPAGNRPSTTAGGDDPTTSFLTRGGGAVVGSSSTPFNPEEVGVALTATMMTARSEEDNWKALDSLFDPSVMVDWSMWWD